VVFTEASPAQRAIPRPIEEEGAEQASPPEKVNLIGKEYQFENFLVMKCTTQHDLCKS
jgi:hypothetical protein